MLQAVETAAHIYPDEVNARNPMVAPDIMEEVKKAEQEQAKETEAEAAFASVRFNLLCLASISLIMWLRS